MDALSGARERLTAVSVSVQAGRRELVRELSVQFTPGEVLVIPGAQWLGQDADTAYARGTA